MPSLATVCPVFPVDVRARAAAREILAREPNGRPVVWLGEEGFEELVARIWAGLWPEARLALRFRASFDPADAEKGNQTIVSTPLASCARWVGFPVIEGAGTVEAPTPAEELLAGEPSMLSPYLMEFRVQGPAVQALRQVEAAAELLRELSVLPGDKLTRLVRLLVVLAPSPEIAERLKKDVIERLAERTDEFDAGFVHALRNIPSDPFSDALFSLGRTLRNWIMLHFVREALTIGRWTQDEAKEWWRRAVDEGLKSAIHRWVSGTAQALWVLWNEVPATIEPLSAVVASCPPVSMSEVLEACPPSLSKAVAGQIATAAKLHGWPEVYVLAIAAGHGPDAAVEGLLDTSWSEVAGALEVLANRYGGAVLVRSAVALEDGRVISAAAQQIVRNPSLLAEVNPSNGVWRRLWLAVIELGVEPWRGIPDPKAVHFKLLDRVLDVGDVEPQLLSAVSRTALADVTDYPRRKNLWTVLPGPARDSFLASTAAGWVIRFRMAADTEQIPEAEILSAGRCDSALLAVDGGNPIPGLHAAVVAFERLPGWTEMDLIQWIKRTESALDRMPQRDSMRLGRVVAGNGWKASASQLFSLRDRAVALRPAVGEAINLLSFLDRLMAKLEGFGAGLTPTDWYGALVDLAVELYPSGPQEQNVWERAGGEDGRIKGESGRERWSAAVKLLRRGGAGTKITPRKLVKTMREDFQQNSDLKVLDESVPR
jgi:hypothetical protein